MNSVPGRTGPPPGTAAVLMIFAVGSAAASGTAAFPADVLPAGRCGVSSGAVDPGVFPAPAVGVELTVDGSTPVASGPSAPDVGSGCVVGGSAALARDSSDPVVGVLVAASDSVVLTGGSELAAGDVAPGGAPVLTAVVEPAATAVELADTAVELADTAVELAAAGAGLAAGSAVGGSVIVDALAPLWVSAADPSASTRASAAAQTRPRLEVGR